MQWGPGHGDIWCHQHWSGNDHGWEMLMKNLDQNLNWNMFARENELWVEESNVLSNHLILVLYPFLTSCCSVLLIIYSSVPPSSHTPDLAPSQTIRDPRNKAGLRWFTRKYLAALTIIHFNWSIINFQFLHISQQSSNMKQVEMMRYHCWPLYSIFMVTRHDWWSWDWETPDSGPVLLNDWWWCKVLVALCVELCKYRELRETRRVWVEAGGEQRREMMINVYGPWFTTRFKCLWSFQSQYLNILQRKFRAFFTGTCIAFLRQQQVLHLPSKYYILLIL